MTVCTFQVWSLCFNIVQREECSSEDIFGVGIGEKFKRADSVSAARRDS